MSQLARRTPGHLANLTTPELQASQMRTLETSENSGKLQQFRYIREVHIFYQERRNAGIVEAFCGLVWMIIVVLSIGAAIGLTMNLTERFYARPGTAAEQQR